MSKKIIRRPFNSENVSLTEHDILNRIYSSRGVTSKQQLDYQLKNLLPFDQLKGVDVAVEILYRALQEQKKILIVGDFDADGATSSALAKLLLQDFGAKNINYLVPNRFEYGYGLSPELVELAKLQNPDLIITVDNGISSIDGVNLCNQYAIEVLITDHHLAGEQLPQAAAIVNPNQPGCPFASKNLAGVGVVFYLLLALRATLRQESWFENQSIKEPNLAHYLDLVALGTVADVVPLDANNRLLVHHGLRLIRAGKCRPGIIELLKIAKRKIEKTSASDLGFAVGPRLNAAGRLDDMGLGIECLLVDEQAKASELAQILSSLNTDRQQVEQEMQQEALLKLQEMDLTSRQTAHSLCLYEAHWHQGVVGLLASRVKDKVNKPCIVFANADDEMIKGSARSVKEVHVRDALALVDARHPKLIEKFGGHSMAAGLSLKKHNFDSFKDSFEQAVIDLLQGKKIDDSIETDGHLANDQFTIDTAQLIAQAGPFGQAFPEPSFDDEFLVLEQRFVGENHLKLTLAKEGVTESIQAIAFRVDRQLWEDKANKVRAVFKPDINDYYSVAQLQLIIQYLEKIE